MHKAAASTGGQRVNDSTAAAALVADPPSQRRAPAREELRVLATKQQIAVVRTLADELERCLVPGGAALAVQGQLVEELARLGCRSLETAAAMAEKPVDVAEQSGTHCCARVRGFVSADVVQQPLLRCRAVALVERLERRHP
jgi:hypothetical protein